jgi:hypothetical protein
MFTRPRTSPQNKVAIRRPLASISPLLVTSGNEHSIKCISGRSAGKGLPVPAERAEEPEVQVIPKWHIIAPKLGIKGISRGKGKAPEEIGKPSHRREKGFPEFHTKEKRR